MHGVKISREVMFIIEYQLRLNEYRQELFDYAKPDLIPQNIASIEQPSKEQMVAHHISRFPNPSNNLYIKYTK